MLKVSRTLLLLCLLTACTGQRVRNNVLLPQMQAAWPGVKLNAAAGGATAEELTTYGDALFIGNSLSIVSQWPSIKSAALTGIQSRLHSEPPEIGPAVANILNENILQFDEAVKNFIR